MIYDEIGALVAYGLDKGLIEAVGRLDAPGRPMLYGTTDKFLRVFGLNSLADLPETEALDTAAAHAQENTSAEDATAESTISNEQDFTQEASDHHSEEKEDSL